MKILALDFSSDQRSVALLDSQAGHPRAVNEVVETGGRATKAFGMIEAVLREAELEREQIDSIVVGLGPGSYTGVRAAISIAQGWQLARMTNTAGISSAEAIAVEAHSNGLRGECAVVIDAQQKEFYAAVYSASDDAISVTSPLRLVRHEEIVALAAKGVILVGPEVPRWFPDGRQVFPRALRLAELVSQQKSNVPAEELEPIYLRATKFVKAPTPRYWPGAQKTEQTSPAGPGTPKPDAGA